MDVTANLTIDGAEFSSLTGELMVVPTEISMVLSFVRPGELFSFVLTPAQARELGMELLLRSAEIPEPRSDRTGLIVR